jgi:hypothetical protein
MVLGFGLALGGTALGQGDPKKAPVTPPPPPVAQDGGTTTVQPDKLMTKEETRKLLASVDTVMGFVSQDSGLAAAKVKKRVLGRDEVMRYLVKNFDEDESAKRLQRSEIVLKKFGLLNRDFNLRPFLLSLLTEQIAGFYDDKTKTVNLLNWVDAEEQEPVLAHELTHAVQDQKVGLEKWSSSGFHGISRSVSEDNARVQTDELETARQAVTEGQAMVVFVDYSLKGTGRTLADAPDVGEKIKESAADTSGSPLMARAPLLLQRSLLFPYSDGLSFEQAVLLKRGKDGAFAGVLESPPGSSYEIMNPAAFMAHVPVPVLRVPDVHAVLDANYEPYDVGVMGELDVEILGDLFAGPELGGALAKQWDGGVYSAAQRRSATVAEKGTAASIGLVYLSRWKSPEAARKFLEIYTAELGRKYAGLKERKADEASGDDEVYSTGEGDVELSISGMNVFVSEGYPVATARKLGAAFLAVQGTGPMQMAGTPRSELTLGLARGMAGFGMVRPATVERYTLGFEAQPGTERVKQ